jgi:serine/threonine protein kinase
MPYDWVAGPNGLSSLGATGFVFKAKSQTTGEFVAIKQIRLNRDVTRDRVLNETHLLLRCDHPNVLRFGGIMQLTNMGTFYLVTRPWAPITLARFVFDQDREQFRHWDKGKPGLMIYWYKWNRIFGICVGLATGLAHLHSNGIKHKDIKPENDLLHDVQNKNGYWEVTPIIADLDHSKAINYANTTDFTKSTYQYLAPEQKSHTESTEKADVFALGCCFALLFALSFHEDGAHRVIDCISDESKGRSCAFGDHYEEVLVLLDQLSNRTSYDRLRSAVWRMLVKDPKQRADIQEVLSILKPGV